MTAKYLYALDLSLKEPGVAIFDLETTEFVFKDSFNTEKIYATKKYKGLDLNSIKMKKITNWMWEIIEKYPPHEVAIERMFSRFQAETITIAKATGVVQCLLWDKPQKMYPPKTVKLAIVHGSATKEDVANAIKLKYNGLEFNSDDESDAFAVGLTYMIDKGYIQWEKPDWSKIKKMRTPKPK